MYVSNDVRWYAMVCCLADPAKVPTDTPKLKGPVRIEPRWVRIGMLPSVVILAHSACLFACYATLLTDQH